MPTKSEQCLVRVVELWATEPLINIYSFHSTRYDLISYEEKTCNNLHYICVICW